MAWDQNEELIAKMPGLNLVLDPALQGIVAKNTSDCRDITNIRLQKNQ